VASLTFHNVDLLCARVDRSRVPAVIDLSWVDFFEPFALVYLGMFLRYWNASGVLFEVRLPVNVKAEAYLSRQNFWNRFNFDPQTLPPHLRHPMTSSTSLNDVVDIEARTGVAEEIAEAVVEVLCPGRYPRVGVDVGTVAEMVSELVHNFQIHARGPLAAFMMQRYPNGNRFDLAIGDCGIGIRRSLASAPTYAYLASQPHHIAAYLAFEAGVTSNPAGGGTGLWEVRNAVRQLGGGLRLATGNGYVQFMGHERPRVGSMGFDLPGVQVEIWIPERR
jgi:hypothetical protein